MEIDARLGRRCVVLMGRWWERRVSRHPGGRAVATGEVSLGHELLIGLDHDAARQAELRGQRTGRREGGAGRQPAAADRGTELMLELTVERSGVVASEPNEQLDG